MDLVRQTWYETGGSGNLESQKLSGKYDGSRSGIDDGRNVMPFLGFSNQFGVFYNNQSKEKIAVFVSCSLDRKPARKVHGEVPNV